MKYVISLCLKPCPCTFSDLGYEATIYAPHCTARNRTWHANICYTTYGTQTYVIFHYITSNCNCTGARPAVRIRSNPARPFTLPSPTRTRQCKNTYNRSMIISGGVAARRTTPFLVRAADLARSPLLAETRRFSRTCIRSAK